MGSRKFGSLTIFVLGISGALDLTLLLSASVHSSGGPYAFLGALSVFFYSESANITLLSLPPLLTLESTL